MRLFEKAYAKVNLYLRVLDTRPDGFHSVNTVMHTVSLFDTLTIDLSPSDITAVYTETDAPVFIPSEKNLATRAALLFLERVGGSFSVNISIEKRIPTAAGLAGGSSDAAAVLRALNRAFDNPLSEQQLLSLAAELGSDVPYCVVGGTALCTGRGEIIEKCLPTPHLYFVIISSGESVSTPKAYAELDAYRLHTPEDSAKAESALFDLFSALDIGRLPDSLYNSFEPVVLPTCKHAAALYGELPSLGAEISLMSGSGPALFGVFYREEEARRCVRTLSERGVLAFFAESVDQ